MHIIQRTFYFPLMIMITAIIFSATPSQSRAEEIRTTSDRPENSYRLAPVTVSANKVEEDAQKTPVSMSVFESTTLDDLPFTDIEGLTQLVPNVSFQSIGSHYNEFNYRGIGGVTTMSKTWNISVDGLTVPYVGLDTLFDVERIEFLRGGQGALYGRNTHGGAINLITKDPTPQLQSEFQASYGSFNTLKLFGAVGGPISEQTESRLALQYAHTDGFVDNTYLDNDRADEDEQFTGRFKLTHRPNDDTTIKLSLFGDTYNGKNGGWVNISGGPTLDGTSNDLGKDDGYLGSLNLQVENAFDFGTLTSITGYSRSNYSIVNDMDATPADIFLLDYKDDFSTLTEEIRLASPDQDARFRWLAGLFFLYEDTDYATDMVYNIPTAYGVYSSEAYSKSSINTVSGAVFGRASFDILPCLTATAGLRVDVEQRTFDWDDQINTDNTLEKTKTWTPVLPSASLTYEFIDDHRIYASVSRGYRSGDFTGNEVSYATLQEGYVVNPEYTWTYEAGYKSMLFDDRVRFNASVFHIDWTDMQVAAISNGLQIRQNAGKAHSNGFEANLNWLVMEGLQLFAQGGFLDSEFDEYENNDDAVGKKIPNTNEFSVGAGFIYSHACGIFASFDATRFGTKYLDSLNEIKQKPYTMLNAKAGYRAENWSVALYGRNLGDERYILRAFESMPGIRPAYMGAPMNFGVEVSAYF